jgi:phosphoribosylformimino-5-aminoimidazole carboxamide ribotide isomerase
LRLIPAIDIQGGRCVRLRQGDFAQETVFGEDPVAMARHWVAEGARYLHVVDLDGAREGAPRNFDLVEAIAQAVSVPVQTGGGLRTEEALLRVRDSRVAKAVLGTGAVESQGFVERALELLGPHRVVVAVDTEAGFVKTRGWLRQSAVRAVDLVRRLAGLGVREVLFTDIARDGMLQSVNLEGLRELAEALRAVQAEMGIIASGGVADLDDLRALRELEPLGVTGVIVGRALYDKKFSVGEALEVLGDEPPEEKDACCSSG